jgi:hypothetical protein
MNLRLKCVLIAGVFVASTLGARITLAASPDACSLLTATQVSTVLGSSVGAGSALTPKLCQWGSPHASGKGIGVMLTLQDARAFAYAKMPMGNGITKVSVSGIGDDAVYGKTPGYATVLTVKKGDTVFTAHVSGFPEDQIKAKEKTLALDVLAKL